MVYLTHLNTALSAVSSPWDPALEEGQEKVQEEYYKNGKTYTSNVARKE